MTGKPVVVFDLDDTLYKERDYVHSGCVAVTEELARRYNVPSNILIQTIKASSTVAEGFDEIAKIVDCSIDEILNIYRNHEPQLVLPSQTSNTLAALKANGITMGLITDGRSIGQRGKIAALGLYEYFDKEMILISEEIGVDKHKPDAFVRMMKSFPDAKFIYVGDNPRKDFYWPNKLGWQTIQLMDDEGVNIKPQINPTGFNVPNHKIWTLEELTLLLHNNDYVK